MTPMVLVSEDAHNKLKKLKKYLKNKNLTITVDEILSKAGWNDSFFARLDLMMKDKEKMLI